jgi:hypothetical protein
MHALFDWFAAPVKFDNGWMLVIMLIVFADFIGTLGKFFKK